MRIFKFVIDRSEESNKKRAERTIRSIVTYRKVSGGSERVGRDLAMVYGVLESKGKTIVHIKSWRASDG
jgi:hypothetical protein